MDEWCICELIQHISSSHHSKGGILWDQFVNMNYYIIYARSDCRLWLKHPCHKLVKGVRIWSIRLSWPLYLCIYNSQLRTSIRFLKCILERRYSIPGDRKDVKLLIIFSWKWTYSKTNFTVKDVYNRSNMRVIHEIDLSKEKKQLIA